MKSASDVVLTAANADSAVEIAMGQELRVRLQAQLGAGYRWDVDANSTDTLIAVASSVESGASQPGGNEIQVLVFRAAHAGEGSLRLRYGRPWEKDAPAAKTFVVRVSVLAKS